MTYCKLVLLWLGVALASGSGNNGFLESQLHGICCECNNGEFRYSKNGDCDKHCQRRAGLKNRVGAESRDGCHAKGNSDGTLPPVGKTPNYILEGKRREPLFLPGAGKANLPSHVGRKKTPPNYMPEPRKGLSPIHLVEGKPEPAPNTNLPDVKRESPFRNSAKDALFRKGNKSDALDSAVDHAHASIISNHQSEHHHGNHKHNAKKLDTKASSSHAESESVIVNSLFGHHPGHRHDHHVHNDKNKGSSLEATAHNLLQASSAIASNLQKHDLLLSTPQPEGFCCECNNGEFRYSANGDCGKHCKTSGDVKEKVSVGPDGRTSCHDKGNSISSGLQTDSWPINDSWEPTEAFAQAIDISQLSACPDPDSLKTVLTYLKGGDAKWQPDEKDEFLALMVLAAGDRQLSCTELKDVVRACQFADRNDDGSVGDGTLTATERTKLMTTVQKNLKLKAPDDVRDVGYTSVSGGQGSMGKLAQFGGTPLFKKKSMRCAEAFQALGPMPFVNSVQIDPVNACPELIEVSKYMSGGDENFQDDEKIDLVAVLVPTAGDLKLNEGEMQLLVKAIKEKDADGNGNLDGFERSSLFKDWQVDAFKDM